MGKQLSLQREALPIMDSEIQDLSLVPSATGTVAPFGCFHACSSSRSVELWQLQEDIKLYPDEDRALKGAIIFTTWWMSLWSLWAWESVPSTRQTPLWSWGFCPSLDLGWRLIWHHLLLLLSLSCRWLTGSSGPHIGPAYITLML